MVRVSRETIGNDNVTGLKRDWGVNILGILFLVLSRSDMMDDGDD